MRVARYTEGWGGLKTVTATAMSLLMLTIMLAMVTATASASPYYVNSLRAQGMGNAYTGVSNDKYAPFYNPAGLTYLRENSIVTIFDGSYGEVSNLVQDLYGDYSDVKPIIDSTDIVDQAEGVSEILNTPSTYRYYRIALMPLAYTKRKFALGTYGVANAYAIYGGDYVDLVLPDSMDDIDSLADLFDLLAFDPSKAPVGIAYTEAGAGIYTALSNDFGVGVGRLSYGGNIRVGTRFTGLGTVNLDLKLNQVRAETAVTAVSDLGLMYALGETGLRYQMGASYNNIFIAETAIMQKKGDKPFPYNSYLTPTVLNIGGAIIIPTGSQPTIDGITLAMDLPDALDQRNISDYRIGNQYANMFNYGAEVNFAERFALRTGLNEGYGTAGAGIRLLGLTVDYAYYVETPPAPVTIETGVEDGTLTLFANRGAVRKHSVNVGFNF